MTRLDDRVLRLAATLEPDEADHLLRSWRHHKTVHTDAELEDMYRSYRAERRERGRQELQRLFDIEGEEISEASSERQQGANLRDGEASAGSNTNQTKPTRVRLDERIARLAAGCTPDDAAELSEWWRWYQTTATDAEMDEFSRHFGLNDESK